MEDQKISWLLVDGLPFQLSKLFCNSTSFPFLGTLFNQNKAVPLEPAYPNCQTPPSLFSIWSGLTPEQHGITGYDLPALDADQPTQFTSAFDHWPTEFEMVWDKFARQQKPVRLFSIPFVDHERLGNSLLSSIRVFGDEKCAPQVLADKDVLRVSAASFEAAVRYRDEMFVLSSHIEGDITIPLGTKRWVRLYSKREVVSNGNNHSILVHAALIDSEPRLIALGYGVFEIDGVQAEAMSTVCHRPGFISSNPGKLYQQGLLGKRLEDGGQGEAEKLLLALLYEVHLNFSTEILLVLACRDADLKIAYYPVFDLLSHQILRHLFSPDAEHRQLAYQLYSEAYSWLEALLVKASQAIDSREKFIMHSDHGMLPISKDLHINTYFQELDLLHVLPDLSIDWRNSCLYLHPADNGLLAVCEQRLVEKDTCLAEVISRLNVALEMQGIDSIQLLSTPNSIRQNGWNYETFVLAPAGIRLRSSVGSPWVRNSPKGGEHTTFSKDEWLKGILFDLTLDAAPFETEDAMPLHDILHYVIPEKAAQ